MPHSVIGKKRVNAAQYRVMVMAKMCMEGKVGIGSYNCSLVRPLWRMGMYRFFLK